MEQFFSACPTSGKEPVTITLHKSLNVEEIPEKHMNLSLLSSLPKSSGATVLTQEDESKTPQDSEFLAVFDDLHSRTRNVGTQLNAEQTAESKISKPGDSEQGDDEEPRPSRADETLLHDTPLRPSEAQNSPEQQEDGRRMQPHQGGDKDNLQRPNAPGELRGDTRAYEASPIGEVESQKLNVTGVFSADQVSLNAKGVQNFKVAQTDDAEISEKLATQHLEPTNKKGKNLPPQDAKNETNAWVTKLASLPDGDRKGSEAQVLQTSTDGDKTTESPIASGSMTTLDRHLGRHPVTLVAQGSNDQRTNPSIRNVVGIEENARQVTGTSFVTSHSSQSAAAPQSLVPPTAQNMQTTGMRVSVVNTEIIGGDFDVLSINAGDELGLDSRQIFQTSGANHTTTAPKAGVAGSVVQQISDAIRHAPDKPIEISLNPLELGRVRMFLSASDAGITVNILAERPDTLDLLRRNIDDLGKSFAEMGYEDISFSFQQGDQTTKDPEGPFPDETAFGSDDSIIDTPLASPQHSPNLAIAPEGIDMRF
ncbi:MAG: flagellar hook-length control protein FliK [Tateyamaria sp.]|uniref:flagellar hook-length control protein FliK n=2 Tax=Tateyamaria sp. TaxID=1929288 RepID=UPI00329ED247